MNTEQHLPDALVWTHDGCLTEVALSTFGDGQGALLPPEAHQHMQECQTCLCAAGEASLLSLSVDHVLGPLNGRVARPFPSLAVLLALLVGGTAAYPQLPELRHMVFESGTALIHGTPRWLHAFTKLAAGSGTGLVTVSWVASALLLFLGFAAVRLLPRTTEY